MILQKKKTLNPEPWTLHCSTRKIPYPTLKRAFGLTGTLKSLNSEACIPDILQPPLYITICKTGVGGFLGGFAFFVAFPNGFCQIFCASKFFPLEGIFRSRKMASQWEVYNYEEKRRHQFFIGKSKHAKSFFFETENHLIFSATPALQAVIESKILNAYP